MKRKVLGKGIAAIIANEPLGKNKLVDLDVDSIHPNPFQPRKTFQKNALQQLAESMKEDGIIQPVVVFKRDGKYFLVVGERRWRAAQLLRWEKIPAVVKEFSDNDVMAKALIENIQREELNAIEIAEGIEALIAQSGEGQQETAEKLGMNRATLANFLRLVEIAGPGQGSHRPGQARPGACPRPAGLEKRQRNSGRRRPGHAKEAVGAAGGNAGQEVRGGESARASPASTPISSRWRIA